MKLAVIGNSFSSDTRIESWSEILARSHKVTKPSTINHFNLIGNQKVANYISSML
jgi:hypothetical protein